MAVSLPQVAGARRHAKIPRILPQTRCRCQESFGTPRPAENGTRVDGIRAAGLRAPLPRHPASEGHRPAAARPPVWALGLNVCSNTSRSLWKRTPKKPTILPSLRPRRLPLRRHPPKPTKKTIPECQHSLSFCRSCPRPPDIRTAKRSTLAVVSTTCRSICIGHCCEVVYILKSH